jgi:hypothetical protein
MVGRGRIELPTPGEPEDLDGLKLVGEEAGDAGL